MLPLTGLPAARKACRSLPSAKKYEQVTVLTSFLKEQIIVSD